MDYRIEKRHTEETSKFLKTRSGELKQKDLEEIFKIGNSAHLCLSEIIHMAIIKITAAQMKDWSFIKRKIKTHSNCM